MTSRTWMKLLCGALVFPVLHVACGDDDPAPAQPGVDAGGLDATRLDATTSEGGASDSGPGNDTGASDTGTADAAADAELDAGADASDASDAAPPLGVMLYMHGNGNMYRVDPADAGAVLLGPSGQTDVRLVWDDGAKVMRGIGKALTDPTLVTVDLCTGAATAGPRIVKLNDAGVDAGPLNLGECWGRHSNGSYYAGVDWGNDPNNSPQSESLATLDIDSGAVKRIAFPFKTTQADCDSAAFIGSEMFALDVNGTTSSGLYRIDLNDAGDTKVGTPPFDVVRIGYDDSRQQLFASGLSRTLYRMGGDAGVTPVGVVTASGLVLIDSLTAAPAPVCP